MSIFVIVRTESMECSDGIGFDCYDFNEMAFKTASMAGKYLNKVDPNATGSKRLDDYGDTLYLTWRVEEVPLLEVEDDKHS